MKKLYSCLFLLLGLISLYIGGVHIKYLFAEQINKTVCESILNNASLEDQRKAVELNKYNPTYLVNISCLFAKQDSINTTIFDTLLIGKKYALSSNVDSSLCYSLKARILEPYDPLFALNCAILTAVKGNVETALEFLIPFIIEGSATGELFCVGGLFEEMMGDYNAARSFYSKGIVLKPSIIESSFFENLTCRNCELSEQTINDAIIELEKIYMSKTDPIVAAKLGKLFLEKNELEKAKQMLNSALHDLPTLGRVWYNLGLISEKEGDVETAQDYYWKSYKLDSSDILPLNKLAFYYEDLKEQVEVLKKRKISHQAYRLNKMYGGTTFNYPYVVDGFEQYFNIY